MGFDQFVFWAFTGLLSGTAVFIAQILWGIKAAFKETNESVKELNHKIAVVIERTDWHQRVIDKHDERLTRIEERVTTGGK